jgi:CspA family cold shock protein
MQGTIKTFNRHKNFGFIVPDDGSPDLFYHVNDVLPNNGSVPPLREGMRVSYERVETGDGLGRAENVKVLE